MNAWREGESHKGLTLREVRRAYSFWGRHPQLYAFLCSLISLGHCKEERLRRRAVEYLAAGQGKRILEIACGTGRDLPYVEEAVGPEATLVALDYTREMLGVARQNAMHRGQERLSFVRGDAATLPFRNGAFDGVLCVFGMSAIPDYPACLREALRVTRVGGRLVVCDGRPFRGGWRWVNLFIKPLLRRTTCWAYERDTVNDLRAFDPDLMVEEFNAGTLFIAALTRSAERFSREKAIPFQTIPGG